MTPQTFLHEFAAYLADLYNSELLPRPDGSFVAPAIYEQELPLVESTSESLPDDYPSPPYVMPKVMDWTGSFTSNPRSITVRVIFCIYDDNKANQGQLTILHLHEMLFQRLAKHPYIGVFPVDEDGGFTAAVTEDDTYPYYFGGVEFKVNAPTLIREDDLA